jgi:hypothetical protein
MWITVCCEEDLTQIKDASELAVVVHEQSETLEQVNLSSRSCVRGISSLGTRWRSAIQVDASAASAVWDGRREISGTEWAPNAAENRRNRGA